MHLCLSHLDPAMKLLEGLPPMNQPTNCIEDCHADATIEIQSASLCIQEVVQRNAWND